MPELDMWEYFPIAGRCFHLALQYLPSPYSSKKENRLQAIVFYLTLPFLYLISILPFRLLYGLSDFLFLILYHLLGYRRKVVFNNLKNSFPEKSDRELQMISRKFYKHLCDMFLETFKTLTITPKEMLRRCSVHPEAKKLLDGFAEKGQSVVLVMGHHGNWEWGGNSFSLVCRQQLFVIYHPLQNTYFNRLIIKMRTRFGTKLIAMNDTFRDMVKNKELVTATAFIADQTPAPENAYWTNFLQQDTPVFWGTERISKKMGFPVVYVHISKLRRGYYELSAEMLVAEPKTTPEGFVTETFTRKLEQLILEQPETWLWSHKRWKHRRVNS